MSLYKANLKGEYDFTTDEVGYWRKAYYIHSWFVTYVQNGEDVGGDYEVIKEQLELLLTICKVSPKELLALPLYNYEGYKYDEENFNIDIRTTIEILDRVLREVKEGDKLIYSTID